MSSAYKNTLVHINERLQPKPDLYIFLTTSSMYTANKHGDSAPPCLTPANTLSMRDITASLDASIGQREPAFNQF